jgi:post-segregation antitoxin (ccd killing protein)
MKQKVIVASNRKSVNVSVDDEMLRQAKDMKINLSRTLEVGLVDLVR